MLTLRHQQYSAALDFAGRQVAAQVERAPDFFPIYTVGGKWAHAGERWTDWTGGFLTGQMWKLFEHTGQPRWRELAEHYSRLLEPRQHDRDVHDLGFIFLNSYRPWFELSGDGRLQDVLVQAGRTLAMRFRERGQYLRSFVGPESLFIDIMMNVPLIFYAARVRGDAELERIGVAHCRTTRDRLVRPDGSTAHEGRFDPETGAFLGESTHQGLGPKSAWARGLAWSMYGFSQVYALSGRDEFLAVAECNADYWLAHLPRDHVPYWDFHADLKQPLPWGPQKDSSAGAIAASALLDLELQTHDDDRAAIYRTTAEAMLDALTGPDYLAIDTPGWEGVLKHGVYHTAKNLGIDESVMWGDYFLVEALTKALGQRRRRPTPSPAPPPTP
ncbi:MAG TPA: glycoside hydrolase family 88 protein [Pirellulales bacterium]